MTKSARHATRVASTRNAGGFLARRLVAEEPTSDELWGIERLEAHGRHLGVDLGVGADLPPIDLAARLRANAERLESAYSAIVDALRQGRAITPAAEWLVDNYHVISEQVGDIPLRLTPELWRSLPVTRHSAARGWPRIYLIASEYLKHSDYSFDTERFVNFLLSYQNLVPLTMRELWALYPIMRIALVDELRRLAVRVEAALDARGAADNLANLLAGADSTTAAAAAELERWTREPRYLGPFAVQLAQRLQQQGELGQPLLQSLTRNLLAQGTSIDRLTQREHARRSSSNLNVRNIMTSLRTLGSFDWRALFERTSRVELLLREQSSYRGCDRRTRDRYRSSIEDLAIATGFDETRVATSALELLAADGGTADSPAADGEPEPPAASAAADIGSVLIGWRRLELERALGAKITSAQRVRRSVIRHASGVYAGAVATLTLALSALALFAGVRGYAWPSVGVLLLGGLALFPASELAIGFVNRQLMRRFAPRHLPRLALGEGLEPDMKTLVVIPVMLGSVADAREAAQDLKVHALANPDPQVRFAVLSDWRDAPTETLGDDQLILDAARAAIAALNAEEAVDSNGEPHGEPLREPRYYLFHRRRQWNAAERCYMGWERKRGKLAELNRLLLRQGATSFVADGDGQLPAPQNIRYVLTLDADTRLPIGAVRDLVGIAAHPLNRPVYSAAKRRVVRGYGLLQPRITPTLPGVEERSLYRDIVTSGSGIDPYAAAVSDVYQDVFGQGLFTGKGLYVLDAFEAAMADRVPENALLSHDLFEGLFARCALVSDIELFEDFPSHSEVAAARAHRWIRGDWQLLPWILGLRGPLPPFGRWKMLDNLRRSLLAPLSIALLITSFCVSAAVAWIWLLVTLSPWLWPALISALQRLPVRPAAQSRRMHLAHLATEFLEDLERGAVALALLAQNAWLSIDAIGRALLRLTVTRRRLLEWVTAAQLKAQSNNALASFAWPLKGASVIVIAATGSIVWFHPAALPAATPLLLLWWLSPLLARFLSTPRADNLPHTDISTTAEEGLRGTARLTWRFFERFVTAEDNALPPDNFQETPQPVVAHRSSPTNFGLYLLSATAARDFGWLGVTDLVQRLEATLGTLDRLERCNGHFFNWYDTRTLAPLLPRYVSTVDSGNLAGHLQALGQAVLQIAAAPLLHPRALAGPLDALNLADLSLQRVSDSGAGRQADVAELQAAMTLLREHLQQPVTTLLAARDLLNSMLQEAGKILDMGRALAAQEPSVYGVLAGHLQLLHIDLASQRRDLGALLPTAAALVPALTRVTWDESIATLPRDCSLPDLQIALERALDTLQSPQAAPSPVQRDACTDLLDAVRNAGVQVQRLQDALGDIRQRCDRIVREMNFRFLFDRVRGLFSIGYRPSDQSLDASYYDLLASEARLTSFVAIAKGDVPRSHWFKLGRRLTGGSRQSVLASWSGSMFEYLMPALVMREPRDSLLDQTSHRIVVHQIAYGALHGLPWGVSESAYNVRDRELTYQYSGFGLPSLGLKRGLGANYVVAPYATALASMYQPEAAQQNFLALVAYGGLGDFGFYEAIDFTPARVPAGARGAVVRAWFAHHQGMSLVALDNALNDHIMQRRFHADPVIKAAELLLQERGVRFADAPVLIEADVPQSPTPATGDLEVDRQVSGIGAATPVTHLLSNRSYSVLVTDSGAGYSRCGPRAVTRWREDATQDCWGSFIYLRDLTSGEYWSTGFQPTAAAPDDYEVVFREERVTLSRRDGTLSTVLDIAVSTEDDCELRRVTLRNDGGRVRNLEITSYAEIVLAPQRADLAHPGFSNLFVSTEFVPELGCLLAMRRPRSSVEPTVWAVHLVCGTPGDSGYVEYETDRNRFIGRGRNLRAPLVIDEARPLSNTVGAVLDPIFSLRKRVSVPASGVTTVTFATLVANSRAQALELASKYRNPSIFAHVVDVAWTFARAELHHQQTSLEEARLFQVLAGHLVFASRQLRAGDDVIAANRLDISHLWRFAISGDRPIVVIRCHTIDDMAFVRQCLRAQEYLRIKQLPVDIVVLNDQRHSYIQDLQDAIEHTLRAVQLLASAGESGERGSAYALRADAMSPAELTLVLAVARAVLEPAQGSLAEQLLRPPVTATPALWQPPPRRAPPLVAGPVQSLEFFNGLGGFAEDGREYVIVLEPGRNTPAPWANVLANEQFGSLVTENGSMCTWSLNSRENQLTAWSNDAVCDPSGEAFYLHEPQTGALWSPTPLPLRLSDARYDIRHGQGYSRFALHAEGIASELTVLVAAEDPVKLYRLRLTNRSSRERRLTIASYVEWALGAARAGGAHNIVTSIDGNGAMLASNPVQMDFGARVAFCDLGGQQRYWTGSRHEFLGRNGNAQAPAGIFDVGNWSGRVGAGLDPCCAFALDVQLEPGETQEIVLVLGQTATVEEARSLVARYRTLPFDTAYRQVVDKWEALLGAVRIRTPDRALDILCNRWLLYQTISCRLWGRAGFYQAGGAFGFRDQLQDGMALSVIAPAMTRAHLLRAAARQFVEGDAQHWWHPPSGRGVRTHFSDDRIWLPFATAQYVETTADAAVLDEVLPFITGPALPLEREDSHYTPEVASEQASLYEHCARALDISLTRGTHGLPLMGGGDWNDGMNRVGHEGRGESVWLAWFLITTLRQFVPLARSRGDDARTQAWTAHCDALVAACEANGWDGAWYRRAYFDDGTPLGSASNAECRIDSLAQSWAVLSGAADSARAVQAMNSVEQYLVRPEDGLVLLFTPPFDTSPQDPGYIKGYLPGLRENGGQYTHAAVWVLMAQASLKNHAQVASLLDMLNPIRRSDSRSGVQAYRVEPYVLAADIYAGSAYARRGGWTWYTGAAGWMHRAIVESVLGIRIAGDRISLDPCLPPHWNDFEVELNVESIHYLVRVERVRLASELVTEVDGVTCAAEAIPLLKDGGRHIVRATVL